MNTELFKQKLETEKAALETQLNDLGRKDPDNPEHWETLPTDRTVPAEFNDEIADRMEDFDERESTSGVLEKRLDEVKSALERIAANTYGTCSVGGDHEIEEDRLEANPAATTCKAHMDTEEVE